MAEKERKTEPIMMCEYLNTLESREETKLYQEFRILKNVARRPLNCVIL